MLDICWRIKKYQQKVNINVNLYFLNRFLNFPVILFMGSSVSSDNKSNESSPSRTSPTMQKSVTHQVIPTCGSSSFQSALNPRPLKGILKNKNPQKIQEKIEKPVKIVELYVLRGAQWSVTRVREVRISPSDKNCSYMNFLISLSG